MIKNLISSELVYFRWKPVIIQIIFFGVILTLIIFFVIKSILVDLFAANSAAANMTGIFESVFISRLRNLLFCSVAAFAEDIFR